MGDDMARERRWDIVERGRGIASGRAFAPNLDELIRGAACGTTEDETPFRRHGHLVLLRVRPG